MMLVELLVAACIVLAVLCMAGWDSAAKWKALHADEAKVSQAAIDQLKVMMGNFKGGM